MPAMLSAQHNRDAWLSQVITIVVVQVIGMHVNKLFQGVPGGIFGAARRAAAAAAAAAATGRERPRGRTSSNRENECYYNGEIFVEGGDYATVMLPRN
jgi:hypothetical protein